MNGFHFTAACLLLPAMVLGAPDIQSLAPAEAAEMAKAPGCYIVDVRSVAEYCLIGHPVSAYNVPLTFWNERGRSFEPNANFIKDIEQRFKTSDVLIFICRSGGRSLRAAEQAFQAGFAKVYNVKEGFEGAEDDKGYRTVGGWKNSGQPYTYTVDPDLAYAFH